MTEIEQLQTRIAHLTKMTEDLSDVVARQQSEIALLTHRVQMLMEREGERQAEASGGIILGDERPPHY